MNINATLFGELAAIFIIVIGVLSYYLGKRKTTTPKDNHPDRCFISPFISPPRLNLPWFFSV
ncbi:MAG: hypothetical protein ACJA13_000102 [Paraglaciecola sp.]|jgi:hypothetical protein